MTITFPCRLITRHLGQRGFTEAVTRIMNSRLLARLLKWNSHYTDQLMLVYGEF
jgi:hypothetical protein